MTPGDSSPFKVCGAPSIRGTRSTLNCLAPSREKALSLGWHSCRYRGCFMEYGDAIVYLTIVALGASVLVIIGLLALLIYKAYQSPPS